jgi:hypothetical protein
MRYGVLKAALAALSLSVVSGAAGAATLVNGGFETPERKSGWGYYDSIDGWSVLGGRFEIWRSGAVGSVPSHTGDQLLELNSDKKSTIFQDVSGVAAGSALDFSFAHRARTNGLEQLTFSIFDVNGGAVTELFSKTYTATQGAWTVNDSASEMAITALGGDVRLQFESLRSGSYGNLLDSVTLGTTPVPVPASLLLLASAMAAFGALRARRRAAA